MRDLLTHFFALFLDFLLHFGFSCGDVNRPTGKQLTLHSRTDRSECAHLAAPKGLDLEVVEGLGEARGEGVAEVDDERGSNSSLRRLKCGVGGVELLAVGTIDTY